MMNSIRFGTDGIRAKAGEFPLDYQSLYKLGRAIGSLFNKLYRHDQALLIAHDTRISAEWIKASILSGLLAEGIQCVDAHIAPTPCLMYGVKYTEHYAMGIIISASHNSYEDNGIKIVTKEGKIDKTLQDYIVNAWHEPNRSVQRFGRLTTTNSLLNSYTAHIKSLFKPLFLKGACIVLDCANGAFSYSAPALLESFGATLLFINADPNGYNINDQCGSTFTQSLSRAVCEHKADIGIALDGDGDRLIVIDAQGEQKDGDDIMSILIDHPLYNHSKYIIGTMMTNKACEEYLMSKNKILHRAPVGDAHVAHACKDYQALLGAESSGHIITYDHIQSGDGLFVALRLLECLIQSKNWSLNKVRKYPQVNHKIKISQQQDLLTNPIASIIRQAETMIEHGRLIVRYSGTEPVLRTMVEATTYEQATQVSEFLSQRLASLFR